MGRTQPPWQRPIPPPHPEGEIMFLRICTALVTRCGAARRRLDERGQTTAEYALVLVGAAAVAVLLLTWATGSGKIAWLLDKMVDTVANMVN